MSGITIFFITFSLCEYLHIEIFVFLQLENACTP